MAFQITRNGSNKGKEIEDFRGRRSKCQKKERGSGGKRDDTGHRLAGHT